MPLRRQNWIANRRPEMSEALRTITMLQPKRLTFGAGCATQCVDYLAALPQQRMHIVTSASGTSYSEQIAEALRRNGKTVTVDAKISAEPSIAVFHEALARAESAAAECVLGVGGGSVLDLAKLLAAFIGSAEKVEESFGIGLLKGRSCHLVCMPTTAGTGSEVSPNAILLDEDAQLKKGVVSPYLVPDATFIDPRFTETMPPAITASTGLDAIAHCLEAYTNKFSHPLVDLYAVRGMELGFRYLLRAIENPHDMEAREAMALTSLYGGLCLGPVNTAAAHALAYPLGGRYHIAHGVSVALLLPHVFRFNAEGTPERHAGLAPVFGVPEQQSALSTAWACADHLDELTRLCGVERNLSKYGIAESEVPELAQAAMTVQRLLGNNPRTMKEADCETIYRQCF